MKVFLRMGLMVGMLAVVSGARADDEKVEVKDLPKAIVDAIKAKFPKAEMTGAEKSTEKGKTTFEVDFKDGDKKMDATLTPEGKLLSYETEVAVKDLPAPVSDAIKAKYPKGTMKSAEWVVDLADGKETKYYEVIVSTGAKKNRELEVTLGGKIQSDEEEEDDD